MKNPEEKHEGKTDPKKDHQKDVETVVSKNDNVKPVPTEEDLKEKKEEE